MFLDFVSIELVSQTIDIDSGCHGGKCLQSGKKSLQNQPGGLALVGSEVNQLGDVGFNCLAELRGECTAIDRAGSGGGEVGSEDLGDDGLGVCQTLEVRGMLL